MHSRVRGFTLIEVLVVVSILAVLMGLVSVLIFKGEGKKLEFITDQRIQQIDLAIQNYKQQIQSRFPPASYEGLQRIKRYKGLSIDANQTNVSCEVLFVALHHPDLTSPLGDDSLAGADAIGNTDDDVWNTLPDGLNAVDAEEVLDAWGTPIVYIEKNSYGTPVRIVNASGVEIEVNAIKKPDGSYYNQDSFQLISLGPDGEQDPPENYEDPGLVNDRFNFKLKTPR